MKHPFIKSVLILGSALALLNCSEEASTLVPPLPPSAETDNPQNPEGAVVTEASWVLQADQTYVISPSFIVSDANGNTIGTYDEATQSIIVGGIPAVQGVVLSNLPIVNAGEQVPTTPSVPSIPGASSAMIPSIQSSSSVILSAVSSSSVVGQTPASSTGSQQQQQPQSSSSVKSSSSQQPQAEAGTCYDKFSGKNVKPYDNLQANGASYAYKEDCSINCYYDPAGQNCANLGSGSNPQQQQQSSSSVRSSSSAKSSSSQAKSSSSQGTTGGTTTGGTISSNYTIKYVSGGKSGPGWATRYWDCCKPHCAWPDKGGLKAHACDARGNRINDDGAKSMCDGGDAGICRGQFPIVVNDNLAFAFAAVPGSAGAQCGKCYDLAFTGEGKYATDNHKALAGKHLIVIASNIGYDVADGQFDIMIPGGGVGIFDGCSAKMGWGSQGARYGGLLTECEESSGYKASTYKSCLTNKCNTSFANDPEAKQGCLFLANWMNASGNPLHEYKEVECPKELLDRF